MMQDAFFCTVGELAAMGKREYPAAVYFRRTFNIQFTSYAGPLIHRVRKVLASSVQGWQSLILLC